MDEGSQVAGNQVVGIQVGGNQVVGIQVVGMVVEEDSREAEDSKVARPAAVEWW